MTNMPNLPHNDPDPRQVDGVDNYHEREDRGNVYSTHRGQGNKKLHGMQYGTEPSEWIRRQAE